MSELGENQISTVLSPVASGAGKGDHLTDESMQTLPPDLNISTPEPYEPIQRNDDDQTTGDFGLPFRVLGYDKGEFFYYPFGAKQIIRLTATAHTLNNLIQLAPLDDLRLRFGKGRDVSDGKMALYMWDELNTKAMERGVFSLRESVRGAGVWLDARRVILHCGDVLYCDGQKRDMNSFLSGGYTYVASAKVFSPTQKPLNSKEAIRLREICESITWENKLSGSLLAGWLVIAPICGALEWRPHIWITGQFESGKSTVVDQIIKRVLGKMYVQADGKGTEPGVREQMGFNALPLIIDEAEPSKNMDSIVELVRGASDGKRTVKFHQDFKAQFITCFSSIAPPVHKGADLSRISFFNTRKNDGPNALEDYNKLLGQINEVFTNDFSTRLLDRTLENIQALLANIQVFKTAARKVLKAARAADQIGPMLAGLYLLGSTEVITEEDAIAWVSKHGWDDHTTVSMESDASKLLGIIFSSIVRISPKTGNSINVTIGEMISVVLYGMDGDGVISKTEAERALRQHGILADGTGIYIANKSEELERLISKSGFVLGMGKWGHILKDMQGVSKTESKYFGPGNKQRASLIPLTLFSHEEKPKYSIQDEVPFA